MKPENVPDNSTISTVPGYGNDMIASWLESTATFKKCTAAKVSFILLGILDLVLTVVAINFGLFEMNPFVRFLFNLPVLLVVIKFVIPLLIAWLIPGRFLLPSIALLAFVVVWNIKELVLFLL